MPGPPTDSRLASLAAAAIHEEFVAYRERFDAVTSRARTRFVNRDWHGLQADGIERLNLYRQAADLSVTHVQTLLGERTTDKSLWTAMKAAYSGVIGGRDDWDLAETFFNSITRRIFSTVGLDPRIEYVLTDFDTPPTPATRIVYRTFRSQGSTRGLVRAILAAYRLEVGWIDAERDAARAAGAIEVHLARLGAPCVPERAEVAATLFFRGQRAYLIGRLLSGLHVVPMAMALVHGDDGIEIDAVLLDEDSVSILFGFTRAYFHVLETRPYDLVRFLSSLLPRKRPAELYISIGHNKHGKTALYRDLLEHLASSDELFEIAPGVPGLVMIAFTMPGYDLLFKVIRDNFAPPKETTRDRVMQKYRLVSEHDRAGRLVDAQEFEHLEMDRRRFTDSLIEELTRSAAATVSVTADHVVLRHAYVERRVIPLDLYVREAAEWAAREAVRDYGQTLRDLAAANIFPGDILLKNFGVTRHRRVVFYDYDELARLTECRFRTFPAPRFPEEEASAEPWFSVGPDDVFPEQFREFLGLRGPLRAEFERRHAELYEPAFWNGIRRRLEAGEVIDILPYDAGRRLGAAQASAGG